MIELVDAVIGHDLLVSGHILHGDYRGDGDLELGEEGDGVGRRHLAEDPTDLAQRDASVLQLTVGAAETLVVG